MDTVIISFGMRKGGVAKTTTAAITCFLLSKKAKVLAVDFDSQGNLTEMISQQALESFADRTIYDACVGKNPQGYIHKISNTLDLIPADENLINFSALLTEDNKAVLLRDTLAHLKGQYDYIIIDTPPHMGEESTNAIVASDFTVIPMLADGMSYKTLSRYMQFIQMIQEAGSPVKVAGLLLTLFDPRSTLDSLVVELTSTGYSNLLFDSKIKKRVRIKEFFLQGITDKSRVDKEALEPYVTFVKELERRVR